MESEAEVQVGTPRSYSVRVDRSGRIVIPVEVRDRFHFGPGEELVLQEVGGQIAIKSYDQVLADAQSYFQGLAEPGVSMVDELLAERRAEFEREQAEEAGDHE